MGSLITWDMKKAEVINYLFPSVFTNKSSNLTVQIAEGKELENWENEEPHTVGDKIWESKDLEGSQVHGICWHASASSEVYDR